MKTKEKTHVNAKIEDELTLRVDEKKALNIDDKLALNLFHVDSEPHIIVNREICLRCPHKLCTRLCPVNNYVLEGDEVVFSWEGCLECGTCRIVCDQGAVEWNYPRGGYGISYRY